MTDNIGGSRELLGLVARGDRIAFRRLYDAHVKQVFRFALLRLGDRQLAEDVTQDTFLTVWHRAQSFRGESRVGTWILGIAYNMVRETLRRQRRTPEPVEGEKLDRMSTGPPGDSSIDDRIVMLRALNRLSPAQQEVIFLAYYQDLEYSEISEVLGIPVGTVKSRVYHAKRQLEALLGGEGS